MLRGGPTGARNAPSLEQINADVFTLTYGSIVRQLISDFEDIEEVNKHLEQMGYNIGIRLVDEFLAKAKLARCASFRETADVIAKQALPMFLNVAAHVTNWSPDQTECSLVLPDNPLADFVELPEEHRAAGLRYCNVLPGVVRGALEMVNMDVEVRWAGDVLLGDEAWELRLKLREHRDERFPYKDDD